MIVDRYILQVGMNCLFELKLIKSNIMDLSAAIPGVDPWDIRGNSAGFVEFCSQCLARDGSIGPLLHFRGEIHGERPARFVTSRPS